MSELKWSVPVGWVKDPLEYRAQVDDGEYVIRGPVIGRADRVKQTFPLVYEISHTKAGGEAAAQIAGQSIGDAPTLKEAKALAQRHSTEAHHPA
jgi:hypothetical protein